MSGRGRSGGGGEGASAREAVGTAALVFAIALAVTLPASAAAQDGPSATSPGFAREDGEEPEPGWRGTVDFGFTLTEGNSETTSLSFGTRSLWRGEESRWSFDGNLVRTTTDGEEVANRGDVSAQYDRFIGERAYLFGRGAASYNEPAGIDLRLSPAAGVGWQAVERKGMQLSLEGGGSWIRDEFSDGTSSEDFFLVASESFNLQVADDTDLEQTLTWEPNTSDFGDYLLEGEVALSTMITEALGLRVSLRDQFDSEPFLDPATGQRREKNDLTFVTGVTFGF